MSGANDLSGFYPKKLLIISGSHRTGSYSHVLSKYISSVFQSRGFVTDILEVARLRLPLHDPDDHYNPMQSKNEAVREVIDRLNWCTAMVWVTPVYHGSFTGGFKNLIDNFNIKLTQKKPTLLVVHGGGRFSAATVEHLRSVAFNLHLSVAITSIITNSDDFLKHDSDLMLVSEEIKLRIMRGVGDIEYLLRSNQ